MALTAGSRGIDRIDQVLAAAVQVLRQRGGVLPFVVPAMGSHGGATAQGRWRCWPSMASPRRPWAARFCASMDTVLLGHTAGDAGLPRWPTSRPMRSCRSGASSCTPTSTAGRVGAAEDDRDRPGQAEGRRHLPHARVRQLATR
ncbi:MAG: hypothetical protein U0Z44_21870 [Kouleothrix sp.]